jgi:hypothetical protein
MVILPARSLSFTQHLNSAHDKLNVDSTPYFKIHEVARDDAPCYIKTTGLCTIRPEKYNFQKITIIAMLTGVTVYISTCD